jgi:hypothetical protein
MGEYTVKVSTVSFGDRVEIVVGTIHAATLESAERIMARRHAPMTGWRGPWLEEVAPPATAPAPSCGMPVMYRGELHTSRGSARPGVVTIERADDPSSWRVVRTDEVASVGVAA